MNDSERLIKANQILIKEFGRRIYGIFGINTLILNEIYLKIKN